MQLTGAPYLVPASEFIVDCPVVKVPRETVPCTDKPDSPFPRNAMRVFKDPYREFVYSLASMKWKAKCTPVVGDATKRTRCSVAAENVRRPVLTVNAMSVSIMLFDFLMPLRDWWIEPSTNTWIRWKRAAYLVEIIAKKGSN